MLTYRRVTFSLFLILIMVNISLSAPLSGTYNVGSGQTYTSLTGSSGFFNAVNVNGLSGNVTVNITSNITESGSVSLNQWSGSYTITIRPSSASLKTLSGNLSSPMINLNGADRVTFDGRYGGSGRYLRLINSNTSGSTVRFINDATYNTITYCAVDGMSVVSTSGIIDFSTTTGSTGNDYNTISYCTIKDGSSGNTLQNAIVSRGTTSGGRYNDHITITNNEIANVYRNGQNCSAILLLSGSTDFTITNNSIYQTNIITPTGATVWNVISVNTSVANNINISGNYLGGSAANCGGSAWTITGTKSNAIYFIRFQTAGSSNSSNVDGNTISNIYFTSTPSSQGVIYFTGILVESGLVNVGTTSGNVIGNQTSTGNITLEYNGNVDNIISRGIMHFSTGDISNNTIGSITLDGNNTRTIRLECLMYSGYPSSDITISNNIIGSSSTANSIQQVSNTFDCQLTGIHCQVSYVQATISGNTISNMVETEASTSSRVRGIFQARSTNASLLMTNNTVSNLYCAATINDRYPDNCALIGIFSGSSSTDQTIRGNTITGLYGTSNSDSYVQGFAFYSNVSKGTFERNRISNLNHSSTTGLAKIWGINMFWGNWNIYNNQISITNGEAFDNFSQTNNNNSHKTSAIIENDIVENSDIYNSYCREHNLNAVPDANKNTNVELDASTNGIEIKGIHDEAEFSCAYYYNSVYIGGSQSSGSANSYAYDRPLFTWATNALLRNNLFFNARTGGTAGHYAMGNEVGYLNWTGTSSDYNVYVAVNSSKIALWGSTDQTIQQWRDSSGGDKHAWSTITSNVSAGNLFNNVTTGDLSIKTGNWQAWLVSGKGIALADAGNDFSGNSRATTVLGGCTDIGSQEFSATPPNNPLATASGAPGSGLTTTYTLWGRTLASINWGTGGTSYPSSMNVRYYSGTNPAGVLGGGYSNSYWEVTPVGALINTTYDITIDFGQNETYTISTPSSNTRLAKYNGTWEVFTTAGTGTWQTELNWASEFVKTRDLNSFSLYALTDGGNPLPVELCSFTAAVVNRQADLSWETCSEVNNKGFSIERRSYNNVNKSFNSWEAISFVDGHGTSNEHNYYRYSDPKLTTGKYQYRLKQIDFNSNFEYHNLNSPSDVVIGTPKAAELFQNYPNPSNPTSKVDFQIPFSSKVSLKVYDIAGKEVASLIDKDLEGGFYTTEFNGANLASGIYFYRLIASSNDGNSFTKTMKLILVK